MTNHKTLAECSRERNCRVGRALGEPHHPGQDWWGSPKARPTLHFGLMVLQSAKVLRPTETKPAGTAMLPIDELIESTRPIRDRLVSHPIYRSITTAEALRVFMEHHAFAVWDFMTLLKALQRQLSCVELPWVPTADRESRRLVNEIVLAEESDDDGQGGHASHFELYLEAMKQAKANTSPIQGFLETIRAGKPIERALDSSEVPSSAREFVRTTWGFVESGSIPAIAAAFTIGREELIPDLFRGIVATLDDREPGRLGLFRHYLDRHVHLDEDEHGPMALRMLSTACGDDPARWRDARFAAKTALEARLVLWDGVLEQIEATAARN